MANFGKTTPGIMESSGTPDRMSVLLPYSTGTDAEGASVTSMSWYGRLNFGSNGLKMIIMDSSGVILADGITNAVTITTTSGWYVATFSTPPIVSASTNYYLGFISNGDIKTSYEEESHEHIVAKIDNANSYTSPTNPTLTGTLILIYSLFATYTPTNTSGEGNTPQIPLTGKSLRDEVGTTEILNPQQSLNILAGLDVNAGLSKQDAANMYAGTVGLSLQDALKSKAGTPSVDMTAQDAARRL